MATATKTKEEKKDRKKRKSLEEFLRVVLEAKNDEEAAQKLELTVSSFRQRLLKERKRYPEMFKGVNLDQYYKGRVGRKPPTQDEAWATLAKIKGKSVEELKKEIQAEEAQQQKAEQTTATANQTAEKPTRRRRNKSS